MTNFGALGALFGQPDQSDPILAALIARLGGMYAGNDGGNAMPGGGVDAPPPAHLGFGADVIDEPVGENAQLGWGSAPAMDYPQPDPQAYINLAYTHPHKVNPQRALGLGSFASGNTPRVKQAYSPGPHRPPDRGPGQRPAGAMKGLHPGASATHRGPFHPHPVTGLSRRRVLRNAQPY